MSAAGSSSQSTGTKRASSSAEDGPPKKKSGKAANGGGTLASYFTISPRPPPQLIASSAPFTDRRSTFVAHAAACTTQVGAAHFADHVRALRSDKHPREADHEMYAWRAVGLKPGKSGLSGEDDWTVKTGSEDDGEKGGGNTIRRAIEEAGGVDVVVVVSRYYGGQIPLLVTERYFLWTLTRAFVPYQALCSGHNASVTFGLSRLRLSRSLARCSSFMNCVLELQNWTQEFSSSLSSPANPPD